jgi:hypothetical protein
MREPGSEFKYYKKAPLLSGAVPLFSNLTLKGEVTLYSVKDSHPATR